VYDTYGYRKEDIDTFLAGIYTKTEADVLFNNRYTKTEANALLAGKAPTVHTHDDRYFTESEVTTYLAGKSDTGHIHDDRYFTESEMTTALAGKSDTTHNHDTRYYQQSTIDAAFTSRDNTIATKETMVTTTFLNDPCDSWATTYSTANNATWANTRAGVNVLLPAGGIWEGMIEVSYSAIKSADGPVYVGVDVSGTVFEGTSMIMTSSYSDGRFLVRIPGMSGGSSPAFKVVFRSGAGGATSTIRSISMTGIFKRTSG
jgi:hypothetical protein